jgi:cytosine/adenosine deaminase-related metal-dependent hydrolase
MNGPLIADGTVAVRNGKIARVGYWTEIRRAFPDAIVRELGNALILPGLVNAHVHLELSDLTPPPARMTLPDWLGAVVKQGAPPGEAGRARITQAVRAGVAECLQFGVTCVGDISNRCLLTRQLLGRGPLRVVSYGEVLAMATRRELLEQRLATAANLGEQTKMLRVGVSPHAPYSVENFGYERCLERAIRDGLPIATHLSESFEEKEFLATGTGPLRDLWEQIGGWDDQVPKFIGGPIRMARELGYLDYRKSLLVHVNYCDDDELAILAAGRASVVICPRTHAYFGHPPHRWREMLALGINVAVGTDSRGSSPDLNLVDDLRLLHRLAPEIPPMLLWEMATTRAAGAIGNDDVCGKLAAGLAADLVVFPATSDDPLREILENDAEPIAVWIDGMLRRQG